MLFLIDLWILARVVSRSIKEHVLLRRTLSPAPLVLTLWAEGAKIANKLKLPPA